MPAMRHIRHDELEATLARAKAGVGASELHGSLTGLVCGGSGTGTDGMLELLGLDTGGEASRRQLASQVQALYGECRAALDDVELGFQPMLPDAALPVPERSDALVAWCRGFLGGFGLAVGGRDREWSDDGEEILRDLGTIAASELACGDGEEDEQSLMEVSEYVRVGVLLLHAEVHGRSRPEAGGRDAARGSVH